jgi:hypothetical protein
VSFGIISHENYGRTKDMIVKMRRGNIKIGHLTQLGKRNDIFEIANRYRLRKGKKEEHRIIFYI